MQTESFASAAWLLRGLFGSTPGWLALAHDRLVFTSGEQVLFECDRSAIDRVAFPWYYFGGGMKLWAGGRRYRLSFVRPNGAEVARANSLAAAGEAGGLLVAAGKITDVASGRTAGKRWQALLAMRSVSILLLLVFATTGRAQTATAAALSYDVPQGWSRTADPRNGTVALRPPGMVSGGVCVLTVFQSEPFTGSAAEFHRAVVRRAGTNARQLAVPQESSVGQFLVTTLHQMMPNGLELWHRVYTARWSDRGQVFVLSANRPSVTKTFVPVADAMIERIAIPTTSVASAPAEPEPSSPSVPPSNATSKTSTASTGALDGVYLTLKYKMGASIGGFGYGVYKDYMVFFPDGRVLWHLPDEGLLNFDVARAQREWGDFWGHYEMHGDGINVVFATGPSYSGRRSADGKVVLGGSTYLRQTSGPDGRSLSGTYRAYNLGTNPQWDITFYSDGRFVDKGIRNVVGVMHVADPTKQLPYGPGTGRYHIGQYSIVFEYTDGRREQLSFYVPGDNASSTPGQLVINTFSVVRVR